MRFDSSPVLVNTVTAGMVCDVRKLPQVHRMDPARSRELGVESLDWLIRRAAEGLSGDWKHVVVDTRLSMLMPGMYPCIPGWHCDDFWRPGGGQPDLENAPPCEHVAIVLGGCSLTRYVSNPIEIDTDAWDPLAETFYSFLHDELEAIEAENFAVKPGEIWRFTERTIHRGSPATHRGWRYFLRLTGSNHVEPKNEIRTQTQVYMTDPFVGW